MCKLSTTFGIMGLYLAVSLSVSANENEAQKSLMIDCKDQAGTTIQVYSSSDGDLYGPPYTNNTDLSGAINPNVRVEIRHKAQEYIYKQNILVVSDGAGQVALQGFVTDGLGVFAETFNFYFEHEGWYLVGDFTIPRKSYSAERSYRNSELYTFNSSESMKCDLPNL